MKQTKKQSLIGLRFGLLVVVGKDEERSTKHATKYECVCDCGNTTSVVTAKLNNGTTKSCGCLRKKSPANKTHGLRESPTYAAWANMKNRCDKEYDNNFENYKARGISYDPRWSDFNEFLMDLGECPDGLTLDRADVNLGYSKENCRWVDSSVQSHNRRKAPKRNDDTYSEYIGVSWKLNSSKWSAKLVKGGEVLLRKSFTSEYEAAVAYDDASEIYYGDRPNKTKASLNEPE